MLQKDIDAVRDFNRFYTGVIGLLDKHILNSAYSLPEVRIMYELYHNSSLTASGIIDLLHLDKGYLSRILKRFERKKLISKNLSENDARTINLCLTNAGKKEFEKLNKASDEQIKGLLTFLTREESGDLLSYMKGIKSILQKTKF